MTMSVKCYFADIVDECSVRSERFACHQPIADTDKDFSDEYEKKSISTNCEVKFESKVEVA